MTGTGSCRCPERLRPAGVRRWAVIQRQCNHSAFNGWHYTPSEWSEINCHECGAIWRTKAAFVAQLRDGKIWTPGRCGAFPDADRLPKREENHE